MFIVYNGIILVLLMDTDDGMSSRYIHTIYSHKRNGSGWYVGEKKKVATWLVKMHLQPKKKSTFICPLKYISGTFTIIPTIINISCFFFAKKNNLLIIFFFWKILLSDCDFTIKYSIEKISFILK